jgi:oxygen-dependent protoporphyrinogen oxidase
MKKIIVVGGGFSGLVTAYYLSRAGFSIELHEASTKLGGLLHTERAASGLVEAAANGFILNDDLVELLADIKLEFVRPQAKAKKRFIFRNGLRRWPLTFLESLGLLVKVLPKFFFNKKSFRPLEQETIWNWGLRNLNQAMTMYLLSPGLQGIYAGSARKMSAELILGPLFNRKKQNYKGTVSFKNGMGEFIEALEKKLRQLGVQIHLNSFYRPLDLEIPHVICISAAAVSSIVEKVAPELAVGLSRIEVLPVLSATVFFENPRRELEGFGALFPADQGFRVLGILSNTYNFENRGPRYSETWIFGGTHSPEVLTKSNGEILRLIQEERKRIFEVDDKCIDYRMYPRPQALPHYTLEHKKILEELRLPKNLYLNGNYLGVIGLSKILSRSKELCLEISLETT